VRYLNFFVISFCFIVFVSGYVLAQQQEEQRSRDIVRIPPPIDDVVTVEDENQDVEGLPVDEIIIIRSSGDSVRFMVEIASSPKQQAKGLMYRNTLDSNKGMLFVFPNSAERSFWMRNTYIPLDLLFIRADGIVHHIHEMAEPHSLKSIKSNGLALAVLEISGGEAKKQNITIGDRVMHSAFSYGRAESAP